MAAGSGLATGLFPAGAAQGGNDRADSALTEPYWQLLLVNVPIVMAFIM